MNFLGQERTEGLLYKNSFALNPYFLFLFLIRYILYQRFFRHMYSYLHKVIQLSQFHRKKIAMKMILFKAFSLR